jgi:hypothetical protein
MVEERMAAEQPTARGRVFVLSPANVNGRRGAQLLSPKSQAAVSARLRSDGGATLGEVFAFVSGVDFRGKLTYASRFAAPPEPDHDLVGSGIFVITPNAGLRSPDTRVTVNAIEAFRSHDIDVDNPAYRRPLETSAARLATEAADADVVLLGSIASAKYVNVLQDIFGDRLKFPVAFVGRGDMSRGGLLLRHAAAGVELEYVPVAGAVRHGVRPPKLTPLCGAPR